MSALLGCLRCDVTWSGEAQGPCWSCGRCDAVIVAGVILSRLGRPAGRMWEAATRGVAA